MGIRFYCPNGHKLNVKSFLAGKRGKCPDCDARFQIPMESTDQPVLATQSKQLVGAGTTANALEIKSKSSNPPASSLLGIREAPETPKNADPISESPESVWYVQTSSGEQFGPADGDLMREWIKEGRVPGNALVWRQGWNDWIIATEAFSSLLKDGGSRADSAPPSIDTIRTAAPRFRQAKKKKSSAAIVLLLFVACIVLFSVLLFVVFR